MLILLPPSEGKTEGTGAPLKVGALVYAKALSQARKQVLESLVTLCQGPKAKALKALGLSALMGSLVERNAGLVKAPTAPAIEVYTGVLFEALDWSGLSAKARTRGQESVLISSALFGVLRPHDPIPAYRLSMDAKLPGLGGLAPFWRPHLATVLDSTGELIIDCRSSTYASAWTPPASLTYAVRVMTETNGSRSVVSHMAKHSRGVLARLLLSASRSAKTIDDVAGIAAAEFKVEVKPPAGRNSGVLTLITRG